MLDCIKPDFIGGYPVYNTDSEKQKDLAGLHLHGRDGG